MLTDIWLSYLNGLFVEIFIKRLEKKNKKKKDEGTETKEHWIQRQRSIIGKSLMNTFSDLYRFQGFCLVDKYVTYYTAAT